MMLEPGKSTQLSAIPKFFKRWGLKELNMTYKIGYVFCDNILLHGIVKMVSIF